ncbi:type II toxin-antitoxin system HicB family antitoxin [Ruminococcus sp.]|uniref:type II toxin-antitoxin system HicB family antitoxin n=1 Tax=Ruminococcus sp. TaxID=41978 RepID=UPI003F121FB9
MKKIFYPAVFTKEENGYWVKFPDLPGCFTEGDSVSEAYEMAQEAMGLWLETESKGFNYPEASDITGIRTAENEQIVLVEFDPIEYLKRTSSKSVKKTLTIPEWLNTLAEEQNINFSQVLQKALKENLHVS